MIESTMLVLSLVLVIMAGPEPQLETDTQPEDGITETYYCCPTPPPPPEGDPES